MKQLILETPRELAQHYLNREFSKRDFTEIQEMQEAGLGDIEIEHPSNEFYLSEFLCDKPKKYKEKIQTLEDLEKKGNEQIKEEFETYTDYQRDENYPMWNTVFEFDSPSLHLDADELAEVGIGLFTFKDSSFLFIADCGYDFYEAHWIPLFTKVLKWI